MSADSQPIQNLERVLLFLRFSEHDARAGPGTTYKYNEHFKATAVRLGELPCVAVQDVAESGWRQQVRGGKIMTKGAAVDQDVKAKLRELEKVKKAYARLQAEHDLLKKP